MPDEVWERVVAFLSSELGVGTERLTPETRIAHDLGCDGDDAWELLTRFGQRFRVELDAFSFGEHFGPEAGFNPLVYAYLRLVRPERLRMKPLTVAQLVEAARTKRLHDSDALAV